MKKLFIYSLAVIVGFALLAALYFTVRQALANAEIEREWQSTAVSAPELKAMSLLEILPLG